MSRSEGEHISYVSGNVSVYLIMFWNEIQQVVEAELESDRTVEVDNQNPPARQICSIMQIAAGLEPELG